MAYGLWQERSLVSSFDFFFETSAKALPKNIRRIKEKKVI